MSLFDNRPELFRSLFGLLCVYLLVMAAIIIFKFGSSPTDENWFKNVPSTLYITTPIASEHGDSIAVGDLLLAVNGSTVTEARQLDSIISLSRQERLVEMDVLRPLTDKKYSFKVQANEIPGNFFRDIGRVAHVFDVIADGASDRAGMRPGDLILTINGQGFKNAFQADEILRLGQIGRAIEYEVLRNNEVITLHVILAAFGFPIALLVFVLCGIVYMGTGMFIGFSRPRIMAARLLGLYFIMMGFVILSILLQRGFQQDLFNQIKGLTLLVCLYASFAVLLHSMHYFPKEQPSLIERKWIRYTGYILGLLAVVATFLADNIAFFIGATVLLLYVMTVPLIYRKHLSEESRKLSRIIKWTSTICWTLAGIYFVLLSQGLVGNIQAAGFAGFLLVNIPIAYLYTIGRYRLLDMNLRVKRTIRYSFASTAWMGVLLLVLVTLLSTFPQLDLGLPNVRLTGASIEITEEPLTESEREVREKGTLMVLAVIITLVVWRIGRYGQSAIARQFHREHYDYKRAGAELSEVMSTRLNMDDLARGIVEKLTSLMHLKQVGLLFFRNESDCCCLKAEGFDGQSWNAYCITHEKEIIQAIGTFKGEFRVDYLPPDLKQKFRENGFEYVIPIRSNARLVGVIFVGEKLSESTFHQEDLEFLASVARQASVAIENAFLYEELAEQERMKHELEIARKIQLASLPQTTPSIKGLEVSGISIPAMEVGGDYFDYLDAGPDALTVIVGDVSGKGTSAALYMSKVQGILRSLHDFGLSPRELFIRANRLLCQDLEKKSFVTAMGGFFDPPGLSMKVARAGHLPLLHYMAESGSVEVIVPRGVGLGLSANGVFAQELEERTIRYTRGDVFLFLSDGVTEARNNTGEEFGEDRISTALRTVASSHAAGIRDSLVAEIKEFINGATQHDDQTVVVVKAV